MEGRASISPQPEDTPGFGAARESRLALLLDQLRTGCGLAREPEHLRNTVRSGLLSHGDVSELDLLRHLLDQSGLSGTTMGASLLEMRSAGAGRPAVVQCPEEGRDNWLILFERRGRRLRIAEPDSTRTRWMRIAEVADRLGVLADEPLEWVVVFSSLPLESLRNVSRNGEERSPISRLWSLVRAEREDVLVVLVFAAGVGLLTLATPIAVQALVNSVAFGTLLQPLVVLALLLLAGLGLSGVLALFETYVVEILQRRIFVRVAADLSERLPRANLEKLGPSFGPELVNRFFDVFTVQKSTAMLLIEGLDLLLKAAVGLLVLALYHPTLLVFDIALILSLTFVVFVLGRRGSSTAVKESKAKYRVAEWLEEMARSPITFKSNAGASYARARVDDLAHAYLSARGTHFQVVFQQTIGAVTLQAIASATFLGLGGWLVIERELTLGQLVAGELIVAIVVSAFSKFGKQLETFYDLLAAVDKLGNLVDLPLEGRYGEPLTDCDDGVLVSVDRLSYTHEGGPQVLNEAALHVAPGEKLALVGSAGSGKSTFLDILYGIRRHTRGTVELCGHSIKDLSLEELRTKVVLLRNAELVEGTILDNVRIGRANISTTQVRNLLRELGFLETIERLPAGLDTELGPGGTPLSSSQAKLLVLGRALVHEPRLLLIDGFLDDLDRATRRRVQDMLLSKAHAWTMILATDELDLVEACKRTIHLEGGRFHPGPAAV